MTLQNPIKDILRVNLTQAAQMAQRALALEARTALKIEIVNLFGIR